MNLTVFVAIFFLQIALTIRRFVSTCKRLDWKSWLIYFFHHATDVFLFWSFLFLQKKLEFGIHLLAVIVVAVHWLFYKNRCIVTVTANEMCGYPEDEWLDSLKNMFGLRKISEYFQFIWLGVLAVQDMSYLI